MTTNEMMASILSQFPGASMVRRSKSNFIAVPTGEMTEEGKPTYIAVKVGTLLSKDTKSNTAFDFDAAVAEYAEYAAQQKEKEAKPKSTKKSGPDPEKQAAKESRKSALLAWMIENPGEHTSMEIKTAMPDVYGDVLIMQVGSDLKELWEAKNLTRREEKGKKYYAYGEEVGE